VAASAYIDPMANPLRPLTAADIETVFRKPAGWSARSCPQARLRQGLPGAIWTLAVVRQGCGRLATERRQDGVRESHVSTRATSFLCPFSLCIAAEQP
jgi:hypothetical protein